MGNKQRKNKSKIHPRRNVRNLYDLLQNPPEFKVDRDYEKEKEKIQTKVSREITDEEWKNLQLSDKTNRFIIDMKKLIIHDRSCKIGRELPKERFAVAKYFDGKMQTCDTCRIAAAIRQITVSDDEYKKIYKILPRHRNHFETYMKLVEAGVKLHSIIWWRRF